MDSNRRSSEPSTINYRPSTIPDGLAEAHRLHGIFQVGPGFPVLADALDEVAGFVERRTAHTFQVQQLGAGGAAPVPGGIELHLWGTGQVEVSRELLGVDLCP